MNLYVSLTFFMHLYASLSTYLSLSLRTSSIHSPLRVTQRRVKNWKTLKAWARLKNISDMTESKRQINRIFPSLNANEIQIPYDMCHKVSSLVKSIQNTKFCPTRSNMKMSNNPAKYEVLIKQYLRSILDISKINKQNLNNSF